MSKTFVESDPGFLQEEGKTRRYWVQQGQDCRLLCREGDKHESGSKKLSQILWYDKEIVLLLSLKFVYNWFSLRDPVYVVVYTPVGRRPRNRVCVSTRDDVHSNTQSPCL